jgi:plastocyanin
MRRIHLAAIVSAVLILSLGLVAACGGDDAPTLEEYLVKMDAVDKDVDARFEEVFGEEEPASAAVVADAFTGAVAFAVDQYKAVSPADGVRDAHERIVSGTREYQTALAAAVEGLDADSPADEFESIVFAGNDELSAAEEKFNTAFCDIQKLADDNNIEADVGCEVFEEGVDPSTLPAEEATEVLIEDFSFGPPHIQVSAGDTVTWTQGADDAPHTATADDESFDSDNLSDEGDTFEFTFDEAGEFSYFCSIHPEMLGLVTVVE